ncbi:MAG: hypothetical protein ACQESP_02895 [Candidatus Muiribacteriota bacterium]
MRIKKNKLLITFIILIFPILTLSFEEVFPDVSPLMYDLDGDGMKEAVFGFKNGTLKLYENDGTEIITGLWPRHLAGAVQEEVKIIETDNQKQIIASTYNGNVYSISPQGNLNWKFECFADMEFILGSPAVDGNENLVYFGSTQGEVHAIDEKGQISWRYKADGVVSSSIELSDATGDGNNEIIFKTDKGSVYMFDKDFSSVNGWPVTIPEGSHTSLPFPMTVDDINSSGRQETIFATNDVNEEFFVYTLNSYGEVVDKFSMDSKVYSRFQLNDINNNGTKDLVYHDLDGYIHAKDISGNSFEGFPVYAGEYFKGDIKLLDIDGNGNTEILAVVSEDMLNYSIRYFNLSGQEVRSPHNLGLIDTEVAFSDVDGNGLIELVYIEEGELVIEEIDITVPVKINLIGVNYEF